MSGPIVISFGIIRNPSSIFTDDNSKYCMYLQCICSVWCMMLAVKNDIPFVSRTQSQTRPLGHYSTDDRIVHGWRIRQNGSADGKLYVLYIVSWWMVQLWSVPRWTEISRGLIAMLIKSKTKCRVDAVWRKRNTVYLELWIIWREILINFPLSLIKEKAISFASFK